MLVLLACVAGAANAQIWHKSGSVDKSLANKKNINNAATRAESEFVFSYFDDTELNSIGVKIVDTYDCAIKIPAGYAGKTITKMSFMLPNTRVVNNVKGWVSTTLPDNVDEADGGCVAVTGLVARPNYNVVELPEGFAIPDGGCYVGYSLKVLSVGTSYGQYPILCSASQTPANGGMWLRTAKTQPEWTNMYGQGFGNLTITATIKGEFNEYAATISPTFGTVNVEAGGSATTTIKVKNMGSAALNSIGYTITDVTSGTVSEEMTANASESAEMGKSTSVDITLNAGYNTAGLYNKTITLTKVNGQDNAQQTETTCTGAVKVWNEIAQRKVLMEEFTGTWCGYCPAGAVGMELLARDYPDTFVGVAAHYSNGDPMEVSAYNQLVTEVSGFPSCFLNRGEQLHPYAGSNSQLVYGINKEFEKELTPAYATVTAKGGWWLENSNIVKADCELRFIDVEPDAKYAIAYVITADGLKDPMTDGKLSAAWLQANNFAGYTADPNFAEWAARPQNASGVVYNHVVIDGKSVLNGIDGSVPADVKPGDVVKHSVAFDLNGNELVQDKTKLHVVAILINRTTGKVVNCDKQPVEAHDPTGISQTETGNTGNTVAERYSADGRRLEAPAKGLNIIKMSNGTVKKVVVK